MQSKQIRQYLLREHDDRWKGATRWGPLLLIPISILVVLLWIFTIASLVLYGTSGEYGWGTPGWAAYQIFSRISLLIAETVHLPLHLHAYFRGGFGGLSPPLGLSLSLIFLAAWCAGGTMFFLLDIGVWDNFGGAWDELMFLRFGLSLAIMSAYFAYMGFAAHAVKLWRKANKVARAAGREEGWRRMPGDDERRLREEERVDSIELGKVWGSGKYGAQLE